MTLVAGSGEGTEGEITLAHELTHALEDQHFGLGPDEAALDDETTAHTALVEGTATVAMLDYTARFLTGGVVGRRQILAQLQATDLFESDSGLPPYLQHSLLFPYSAGARFVDAIGTWGAGQPRAARPGSRLHRADPPSGRSTARGERPLRVAMPRPPGPGWKRAASGTIGEFDTARADPGLGLAAAGRARRGRLGRGPVRAVAERARAAGLQPAPWRGAGTRRATRRSSLPRCRATSSGHSMPGSRGPGSGTRPRATQWWSSPGARSGCRLARPSRVARRDAHIRAHRTGPLRRPRRDAPPEQRCLPALLRDGADRVHARPLSDPRSRRTPRAPGPG